MPWRRIAASVATPVVTGCHGVTFEQLDDDGQQTCAAQLCDTNLFWTVRSKLCAALLPNTSTADTDTVTGLLNTVVEGQKPVHAGVVMVLVLLPLPVLEVADAPVNTCMKRVPFWTMST